MKSVYDCERFGVLDTNELDATERALFIMVGERPTTIAELVMANALRTIKQLRRALASAPKVRKRR